VSYQLSSWNKLFMIFWNRKTSHLRKEHFYDYNWLFDVEFLVNVTNHHRNLNIKLQGKNKLFPNLINLISAFSMKF